MFYGIIYLITNKVTGKYYVGQTTVSLKRRWSAHCKEKSCRLLHNSVVKHGRDSFLVEKVFECGSREELNAKERECIVALMSHHRANGYNLTTGGDSCEHSEETRLKLGQASLGRTHSEESKKKMSEAAKGRVKSQRHMENITNALRGYKHSDKSKANMSNAHKGKALSTKHRLQMSEAQKARQAAIRVKRSCA